MDDRHGRLRALAAAQDGQFATGQALGVGLARSSIARLGARGETVALRRGVWRYQATAGQPDPAVTSALACWPDAVISHRSAAARHGLARAGPALIPEVTLPHGVYRAQEGILVHRTRCLPPGDVLQVGGIGYTSLARTLCDLADGRDDTEVLGLLDEAVALGARPRWIHQRATELGRGRGGVALLGRATAPGGSQEFRSWLERSAAALLLRAGLPEPEWNVAVHDRRGRIGVVDAYWRPWRLVGELEGLRFHTTPAQRRGDAARFNRLLEAGFTVRRFTWEDIVQRGQAVVDSLGRVLSEPAGQDSNR